MPYDFDRLLDPTPMRLEMGYERHASGVLEIAARTDLHGCTGAMLAWWFGSRPADREYRWWHPIDHLSSSWKGGNPGETIGSTHVVTEKIANLPAVNLLVQFRDPREAFGSEAIASAKAQRHISALIYGHAGTQEGDRYTSDGRLIGTRLIHICRDTEWGTVLRSRFLFGYDLPGQGLDKSQIEELAPDAIGPNLVQHCYEEFTFLSRLLPSLYATEHLDPSSIVRPW